MKNDRFYLKHILDAILKVNQYASVGHLTVLGQQVLGSVGRDGRGVALAVDGPRLLVAFHDGTLQAYVARLVLRQTRLDRLPVDGSILAFAVWTLLSASFSRDPVVSHENAKKLLLFVLLYLAADAMRCEERRERIPDAALLGGVALAIEALIQFYILGYDTLNQRPRRFLGHYMTMSGLLMGDLHSLTASIDALRTDLADARAKLAPLEAIAAQKTEADRVARIDGAMKLRGMPTHTADGKPTERRGSPSA